MNYVKCHYYQQLDHMKSRCPDIYKGCMKHKEEDIRIEKRSSINMASCEDGLLVCEEECDYEVKRCETFNKGRLYCVKVGTHPSFTSNGVKKK